MSTRRPATLPPPRAAVDDAAPAEPVRRPRRVVAVALVLVSATLLGWALTRPDVATSGSRWPSSDAREGTAPTVATTQAVTWQDFSGLSLPVSSTDGPRCTTAARSRCFTRTDAGAALAAVHLLVKTFPFAGSAVFGPTIREQVTGPDAAAFARLTRQAYDDVAPAAGIPDGAPVPSEGGWVAGYRLDPTPTQPAPAPTGDERRVAVLIRQTDSDGRTGFTEYSVRLVWRHDDWALVAPAWGDWRNAARALPDADRSRYLTYDGIA